MKIRITLSILIMFLLIGLTSAVQVCEVYDDFSSGSLNLSKWEEIQDPEGQPFTNEHFVDVTSENYQVKNIDSQDRRTILNLIGHTFQIGETLEYNVNYISGGGNRAMVIFVDGGPLDRASSIHWGGGSIGHNGQDFVAGNLLGLYNVKLEFKLNGINITIVRPDNSIYFEEMPITSWVYGGTTHSTNPPFNLGFETWSNGDIYSTYDNFEICSEQEIPDTTDPDLEIIYPIYGTTYTSHITELTFDVFDENLNFCTYSLDGFNYYNVTGAHNGINTITGITSIESENTWYVTCTDNAGNTATGTVTFFVDINNTDQLILIPTTPTPNQLFYEPVTFKVSTNKNATVIYSLDGATNITMTEELPLLFTSLEQSLSIGRYEVTFCAEVGEELVCKTVPFEVKEKKEYISYNTKPNYYNYYPESEPKKINFNNEIDNEIEVIELTFDKEETFWDKIINWLRRRF